MSLSKREYEDYKAAVDKMVYKYVARDRSSVVSAITHAVDSGCDKRKVEDKLMGYVDKSMAYKLAEKAFLLLEDIGTKVKSTSSRKRTHKEDNDREKDSKRARVKDEKEPVPNIKASQPPSSGPNNTVSPGQIQAQQIKDIMAKAQAVIEERKKAMANLQTTESKPTTNGAVVIASAGSGGGDVTSRIAELQARIQAQLGNATALGISSLQMGAALGTTVASTAKPLGEQSKPTPLILDAEGRTVDQSGKEVHLTQRIPTLKANIRAKKREEFKQQLQEKPIEDTAESNFFDARVSIRPSLRVKRPFKFHDQGKFIQLAQRERAKARLEKLQNEISQVAKKTGISSAAKLAQLEQREMKSVCDDSPDIEWWDAIILQGNRYPEEGEPVKVKDDCITRLIEHPLEMRCPSDPLKPVTLEVLLTKQERKKLRRMNRRETWKEKQEKIRLGLEPPPEPKVRMANLMRVLGTEAVLDPTKMEKHVREQMAKRLKAHQDANAARKLTPEQLRDKKVRKVKEDTSTGVHVTVYKVTDFSNGSHKFKVETNAKQLFLTGTVVLFKDINVVVVEGGPKQQKKYKRLMMERIKWAEESRSKDADIESKCQLVWEGTTSERSFGEMLFKACPTESFARDHFKKHGVEQYWDLAYGKKILEEADSGN
ncbi:U4/U6 small nuclear ribonucleoprotein Prp3-like isoform X2 [Homarus americanus]|uniref:U4/U6 small nuclear ribonucleoprotein Prp3-like isoform X2 n=1 Tax=Homarus americanus TaxID=6706 RepID=UPI001C447984|nr:U4/U6 small nuclear ribonucleoprotein Prp3-like isoform X2 [Homarus americanus]